MKSRYLIWLNWPERPFRLSAADLRLFRSLVHGGEVKAVRSERAFLRERIAEYLLCPLESVVATQPPPLAEDVREALTALVHDDAQWMLP